MVKDFLLSYARLLVNHPEDVSIEISSEDEGYDDITIYANSDDAGKLIGKGGRMIHSMKTLISGCKAKGGKNYRVNIKIAA